MKVTKELSERINQYIIGCIDTSGYDDIQRSENDRIKFVYEQFKKEYCFEDNLRRYGNEVNCFSEWLMGLPSIINIEFRNYRILELSQKWGFIKENAPQRLQQQILDRWFSRIAIRFFQLLKKANRVPKTYQRKTQDEFEIQGCYNNGWECVTTEENRKEARERLKEYRENEHGTAFRMVVKRVKLVPAN